MREWIESAIKLPKIGEEVETSEDGIEVDGKALYLERRTCMMAGIAGGHGYFGEGFATTGEDCDYGLILDKPKFWRPV